MGVMDNMTAKVSCFARAYHYKNNRIRIFEDSAAEMLLGSDYEQVASNMAERIHFFFPEFHGTKEEGLRMIVDKQLSPSVLARSAFCEDKLKNEIEQGCRQYVLFAAGYDTFALRNEDSTLSIYELDLPEMLADKTERIKKAEMKSDAVYVPCNLAEMTWKEHLLQAGYQEEEKSFGSLLGISYYLKKEEFLQLLQSIGEIMAAGSSICFDYPSKDESQETRTNQKLASAAGEQMKALYSEQELKMLLENCGFEISEHIDCEEMTKQYFEAYNCHEPIHPMQAPNGVFYVLAKRK